MGSTSGETPCREALGRRGFLASASGAAAGLLACGAGPRPAHADALTREQRDSMTPDDIIAVMRRGNERFRSGENATRNYLAEQAAAAAGQYPAAVVLSCIDSRAPAEVILDLGIGDVFNARVAGNIVNDDILGSMEFACKVAGAKVVLVLGHTACGAIKGAIDDVKLGHLTGLLAGIRPAVPATEYQGERTSQNTAFVDAVARTNVERMLASLRERSTVLKELESSNSVKFVGAMYDLQTAAVEFFA